MPPSSATSSGTDSSSEDDERRVREERKKSKKHKKEKHKKDKKSKHKKDKKSKHKKDKKAKKSSSDSVAAVSAFGKYGILGPQDRFHKQQEFFIWLREVKEIEPENQPSHELNSLWTDYAEDYNTVTLPGKKYYNLEAWEAKQAKKRKAEERTGGAEDGGGGAFSLRDDERALAARHTKRGRLGMSREELLEMKKIMAARAQNAVKKDLNQKIDEKSATRTQSMMRGLVAPGMKTV